MADPAEWMGHGDHSAVCCLTLLNRVRFFGDGFRTRSLQLTLSSNKARFTGTVQLSREPGCRGVRLY